MHHDISWTKREVRIQNIKLTDYKSEKFGSENFNYFYYYSILSHFNKLNIQAVLYEKRERERKKQENERMRKTYSLTT